MNSRHSSSRSHAVNELAARADIVAIAQELGLRVSGQDSHAKALCPFHDDHTPSLVFYPAKGTNRGYYHCFACAAHGDVFALIKHVKKCDFFEALRWLANRYQFSLPPRRHSALSRAKNPREGGLELARKIYERESFEEAGQLQVWAESRGFSSEFLSRADVFFARGNKLVSSTEAREQETLECLIEAGVVYKNVWREVHGSSGALPMLLPPRDLFSVPRVMFTLRDSDGELVGFAGRAVGEDQPKYLFSQGFPRAKTLYRLDRVKIGSRRIRLEPKASRQPTLDIFVVEGLMDALRLESLGMFAVGIFGSSLTDGQVDLISRLVKEASNSGVQVLCHLFLDSDDAGRKGIPSSLTSLLIAAARGADFGIDVILLADSPGKTDPDELLRDASAESAKNILQSSCTSVMDALVALKLGVSTVKLDETMREAPASLQINLFREIERVIPEQDWTRVLDRSKPFEAWLRNEPLRELSGWRKGLDSFLRRAAEPVAKLPVAEYKAAEKQEATRIVHALQLAQSSGQRKELPVDELSWERMLGAIDALMPHFQERLRNLTDPGAREPMVAVRIPKRDKTEMRLKALPCPEALTLQQYVLNEILRDYIESPQFMELVPGVRRWSQNKSHELITTGLSSLRPTDETHSFAYQIDMDVLSGLVPPRREGMFRPYFDCWQDFIAHIDRRVSDCDLKLFHVARLDIRGFYDLLPRHGVIDVLFPCLRRALEGLPEDAGGAKICAQSFRPKTADASERARQIVDWLCDESFGYTYLSPETGKPMSSESAVRGIPQGPDLSAYLANIALFPLDKLIVHELSQIENRLNEAQPEPKRWTAYARYVDDLVVVAPTANDLTYLRARVEDGLAKLGLELSPKTDPLPPMDKRQLRKWLTERRGAALGASGPFEGNLTSQPITALEPLAEVGDIDRSDSLLLLYDTRMEHPETPIEEVVTAVRLARQAAELRHSDLIVAARRLWRCVAEQQSQNSELTAADALESILNFWTETQPQAAAGRNGKGQVAELTISVILEGLEQFLGARVDRNPKFSSSAHDSVYSWRCKAAAWVQEGLCAAITSKLGIAELSHMLQLRVLSVRVTASLVARNFGSTWAGPGAEGSPAKARLLISLAQASKDQSILDRADLKLQEGWSEVILFHEAVARLSIVEGTPPDPLHPISYRVEQHRSWLSHALGEVLKFWCPNYQQPAERDFAEKAAFAMRNVALAPLPDLLMNRPHLVRNLLSHELHQSVHVLPAPPAVGIPGLVGWDEEGKLLYRLDMDQSEPHFCPRGLRWSETNNDAKQPLWRRLVAQFDSQLLPRVPHPLANKYAALRWLALAFRNLVQKFVDGDRICIPNACNLLGPPIGSELASGSEWEVVGYEVSRSATVGQAFIRQGNTGLVPQPVAERYDDIWRVGTALADYLGYIDKSTSLRSLRLSSAALTTSPIGSWAEEGMLRFSLHRLRGLSLPSKALALHDKSKVPLTLERVLKRLESFPPAVKEGAKHLQLAHLLATLAEGRALRAKQETRFDPGVPGGASALLAEITRLQFIANEDLADQLPAIEKPAWAPERRVPLAWVQVALRLRALSGVNTEDDGALEAMSTGAVISAVEAYLRAQALEQWALTDAPARKNIIDSPPTLASWDLDGTCMLHCAQGDPVSKPQEANENVVFLLRQLLRATSEQSPSSLGLLRGITPLGWLVITGTLSGALGEGQRGRALPAGHSEAQITALTGLRALAEHLYFCGGKDDDPPWSDFEPLIQRWNLEATARVFNILREVDEVLGITVDTPAPSPHFAIKSARSGTIEISTPKVTVDLPVWQISADALLGEGARDGVERFRMDESDPRLHYRWCESWAQGRLVSVGILRPGLAALAGLETTLHADGNRDREGSSQKQPLKSEEISSKKPGPLEDSGKSEPIPVPTSGRPAGTVLADLQRIQESHWKTRSKPHDGERNARIALLQWKVDDTYRHPIFDACDHAGEEVVRARKSPQKWTEDSAAVASCNEHRRIALLRGALRACKNFGVDILLLPEYSVRPETVTWLKENLAELSPDTAIWAGTYRQPPFLTQKGSQPDNAWRSVVPVVLPNKIVLNRRKKYPAIAVNEIFHPENSALNPIYNHDKPTFDPKAYVLELVCSEVFIATSPSNFFGMVWAQRELSKRFGKGGSEKELEGMISEDILNFARLTSISHFKGANRRSIILVPAMTNRAVDYMVLGQASLLAAGLTTVFCNAAGTCGRGESCFIGFDGWDKTESDPTGLPGRGPYHGIEPGIYRPSSTDRGLLGQNEEAMVIADVDPVFSIEGKPRPQMMLPPLRLVAHLPLIDPWKRLPNSENKDEGCRCKKHQLTPPKFPERILRALVSGEKAGYKSTFHDADPSQLADALEDLAKSCDDNYWVTERRRRYLAAHAADPQGWPPPVALDWIYIDLGDLQNVNTYPTLELPRYCKAPGEP